MKKDEVLKLQNSAIDIQAKVSNTIIELTKNNPLIVFDSNTADDDIINELPYGYTVNKYGHYCQGAIERVSGRNVELFLTGDDYGTKYHTELDSIPFESLCGLLLILHDRL